MDRIDVEDDSLRIVVTSLQPLPEALSTPFMSRIMKVLTRARLNPGGILMSCFVRLTHEGTKPEICALSLLSMALAGQDTGFDQEYVADSMHRGGFKSVRSRTLNTPLGPMELDIARK